MRKCEKGRRWQDKKDEKEKNKLGAEDRKEEVRTTSVMFVEKTVGGELAKRLREKEERIGKMTGYKLRIVEMGGHQLKRALPNTNPWKGSACGREDCVTCSQGENNIQDCSKRNILYESRCTDCEEKEGKAKEK